MGRQTLNKWNHLIHHLPQWNWLGRSRSRLPALDWRTYERLSIIPQCHIRRRRPTRTSSPSSIPPLLTVLALVMVSPLLLRLTDRPLPQMRSTPIQTSLVRIATWQTLSWRWLVGDGTGITVVNPFIPTASPNPLPLDANNASASNHTVHRAPLYDTAWTFTVLHSHHCTAG